MRKLDLPNKYEYKKKIINKSIITGLNLDLLNKNNEKKIRDDIWKSVPNIKNNIHLYWFDIW